MDTENNPIDLFTKVAPRYELLNTMMTMGQDLKWRRTLLKNAESALGKKPTTVLDLACGTGNIARLAHQWWPQAKIMASDPNQAMLVEAQKKKFAASIDWIEGRAEDIEQDSQSMDLITIAFGFRNVEKREKALQETFRVLKPGGVLAILELGLPHPGISRTIYSALLNKTMPTLAGLLSSKTSYKYLAKSIQEFPEPKAVREMLFQEGFIAFTPFALNLGVSWIFIGKKPSGKES